MQHPQQQRREGDSGTQNEDAFSTEIYPDRTVCYGDFSDILIPVCDMRERSQRLSACRGRYTCTHGSFGRVRYVLLQFFMNHVVEKVMNLLVFLNCIVIFFAAIEEDTAAGKWTSPHCSTNHSISQPNCSSHFGPHPPYFVEDMYNTADVVGTCFLWLFCVEIFLRIVA